MLMKSMKMTVEKALKVAFGVCLLAMLAGVASCGKDDDDDGPKEKDPDPVKEDVVIDPGIYYRTDGSSIISYEFDGKHCHGNLFNDNVLTVFTDFDYTIKGDTLYETNASIFGLKSDDGKDFVKRIDNLNIQFGERIYTKDPNAEETRTLPEGPYAYDQADRGSLFELFVDGNKIYFVNTVDQHDLSCTFYAGTSFEMLSNAIGFVNPTDNEKEWWLLKKYRDNYYTFGPQTLTNYKYSTIPDGTYASKEQDGWIAEYTFSGYKVTVVLKNTKNNSATDPAELRYFVYNNNEIYFLSLNNLTNPITTHAPYAYVTSTSFKMNGDTYTKK